MTGESGGAHSNCHHFVHTADRPNPPAYEDGTDREFRNVGYQRYMDAGDLPKR